MNGFVSLVIYGGVLYKKYKIYVERKNLGLLFVVFFTLFLAILARNIKNDILSIGMGLMLLLLSSAISITFLKNVMGIDVFKFFSKFLKK